MDVPSGDMQDLPSPSPTMWSMLPLQRSSMRRQPEKQCKAEGYGAAGSTSMPSTASAPPADGDDMPPPAVADMVPATGGEDMPPPGSAVADMAAPEAAAEVATPTGADELGEPATEARAREIARAERAARYSRKSSAYHKAAARAKKEGLSKEEIKAAGKAVTWIHIV